jgi:methyl-accepting chemotaxis protein
MGIMRKRFSDESGLAGGILVGVVAWAFVSVACLVTILMTANHIDERVAFIRNTVSPIDHDLDSVKLLDSINARADAINAAAAPLSGQLGTVKDHTDSILGEAAAIDDTAKTINGTVHSIDGNVNDIHGSVLSINSIVHGINGTVRDIDANATSINGTAHSIEGSIAAIDSTAKAIRGDHNANGLGSGLAGAARRLDVLLGQITGIKADTGNILSLVGSIQNTAKHIDTNMP